MLWMLSALLLILWLLGMTASTIPAPALHALLLLAALSVAIALTRPNPRDTL